MIVIQFVSVVIVGYLIGSIPFGVLIGRRFTKVDIRALRTLALPWPGGAR